MGLIAWRTPEQRAQAEREYRAELEQNPRAELGTQLPIEVPPPSEDPEGLIPDLRNPIWYA